MQTISHYLHSNQLDCLLLIPQILDPCNIRTLPINLNCTLFFFLYYFIQIFFYFLFKIAKTWTLHVTGHFWSQALQDETLKTTISIPSPFRIKTEFAQKVFLHANAHTQTAPLSKLNRGTLTMYISGCSAPACVSTSVLKHFWQCSAPPPQPCYSSVLFLFFSFFYFLSFDLLAALIRFFFCCCSPTKTTTATTSTLLAAVRFPDPTKPKHRRPVQVVPAAELSLDRRQF